MEKVNQLLSTKKESIWISYPVAAFLEKLGLGFLRYGLVFLMTSIGLLKFTLDEAKGIYPWVSHSPFMSWIYSFSSVQGGSDIIGTFELLAASLIAIRYWNPKLSVIGSFMGIIMFLGTLSFYFTTPGIIGLKNGIPQLADGGFIIKDLVLLGASIFTASESINAYLKKQA